MQRSKKKGSDELEIIVSSRTHVEKSAKRFCVGKELVCAAASVSGLIGSLEEISDLAVNQHVSVTGPDPVHPATWEGL